MTKLFTSQEFNNAKNSDLLPLKCEECGKFFGLRRKFNRHPCIKNKKKLEENKKMIKEHYKEIGFSDYILKDDIESSINEFIKKMK